MARDQPVDARQGLVPVAQQVEQHHRYQQQVDDEGEQRHAADAQRPEQLAHHVLVDEIGGERADRGDVEL
jgi:hypothetical protein